MFSKLQPTPSMRMQLRNTGKPYTQQRVATLETVVAAVMIIIITIIINRIFCCPCSPFSVLLLQDEVHFTKIRGNPNLFIGSSWGNYPARNNSAGTTTTGLRGGRREWLLLVTKLTLDTNSDFGLKYRKFPAYQVLIQKSVLKLAVEQMLSVLNNHLGNPDEVLWSACLNMYRQQD